jgi:hypothetical protein
MPDNSSGDSPIPPRMRWSGRPLIPEFDPGEMLYHRLGTKDRFHRTPSGQIHIAFRVGDTSVNRTVPDGAPLDCTLSDYPHHLDDGVIGFAVASIPRMHLRPGAASVYSKPVHDPLNENYYHTEIRCFRDSVDGERIKNPSPSTVTWFRTEFSKRLTMANIIKQPRVWPTLR